MRVIVPLWLSLLTAVSLAPDHIKVHLGTKGPFHRAAHLIVFVATGLIFCWNPSSLRSKLVRSIGACCVALVLELLEAWCAHNNIEWADVWWGCLGVLIGFCISAIVQRTTIAAPS